MYKLVQNMNFSLFIAAPITVLLGIIAWWKLSKPRNIFDEMSKYLPASPEELPDAEKSAAIKRCNEPDEELEIVSSETGIASQPPTTMVKLFQEAVERRGDLTALAVEKQTSDGKWTWKRWTWNQFNDEAQVVGKALLAMDIQRFDVCNLLGHCSPRYCIVQMGIMMSGAIPAGIYSTSLSGSIKHVTNLCQTRVAFVDTKANLKRYLPVIDDLKSLKCIVVFRDNESDQTDLPKHDRVDILSWQQFLHFSLVAQAAIGASMGTPVGKRTLDHELEERQDMQEPGECVSLVYTSGTTGDSKAVMLSNDNLWFICATIMELEQSKTDPAPYIRHFAYLPLSHVAGQLVYFFGPLYMTARCRQPAETWFSRYDWKKTLLTSLRSCQPTTFFGVPRIWEKMAEGMAAKSAEAGLIQRVLMKWVKSVGSEFYHNRQVTGNGEIPKWWPFISKYICDGLIKKALGLGNSTTFSGGGAPLNPQIRELMASLNMLITDGYGMTETCGLIAATRYNNLVVGACGPPLDGVDVKLDHRSDRDPKEHGEICVRGRNVMMGYLNQPDVTREMFDKEGFLHTGDVGRFDKYNCLHITGRIKELIVTGTGKNIAPVPIEHYLQRLCPAVSHFLVIGDNKKYLSLLVCPVLELDPKTLEPSNLLQPHAQKVSEGVTTIEEAQTDKGWHEYIRKAVQKYNADANVCVSNSARIRYFQVIPHGLSVGNNTLSATMKTKRSQILREYADSIKALYSDTPSIAVDP